MEIAVALLGGLGLFLTGLQLLSSGTKQMSGRWLRAAVAAGTRGPLTSAITGFLAGAVTQSTSAVTIVASGLVQSGLLEVRRALPLLSWTNIGTCGVVLMASLNPQTMALVLVGVAGLLGYFGLDLRGRLRPLLGALLGLGVLFLGLGIMKAGIAPLREVPWVAALMGAGGWLLPPFLAGGLIAFVSQTSSTATLIALAFTATGLMSFEQTVMAIYGASIGSGFGMLLAAGGLRGTPRRMAQYQVLWKCFGTLVFVALFFVERAGLPLVMAASGALTQELGLRVGLLVLLFQTGTAILIWPLDRLALRILARWSPETAEEALSRPAHIYPAAAAEAATALSLAAREQARLAARLPPMLDALRPGEAAPGGPGRAAIEAASPVLEGAVGGFLAETLSRAAPDREMQEAILAARARNADLAALREAVGGFAAVAEGAGGDGARLGALLSRMTEALHLMLGEFTEVLADGGDAGMLVALTAERSDLLDSLRRGLAAEASLSPAAQEALIRAIALFERAVWLMRRQALALSRGR